MIKQYRSLHADNAIKYVASPDKIRFKTHNELKGYVRTACCNSFAANTCAWNSLPASVRDIQSLHAFRQKLKLTLFSDSFAS